MELIYALACTVHFELISVLDQVLKDGERNIPWQPQSLRSDSSPVHDKTLTWLQSEVPFPKKELIIKYCEMSASEGLKIHERKNTWIQHAAFWDAFPVLDSYEYLLLSIQVTPRNSLFRVTHELPVEKCGNAPHNPCFFHSY